MINIFKKYEFEKIRKKKTILAAIFEMINLYKKKIGKKEKKKNLDKISKLRWIEKEYGENSIFHFFSKMDKVGHRLINDLHQGLWKK